MLSRCLVILVGALITQPGCTSMESAMITRDETNQFWTRKADLKGVPITLKVPTHVKLTVFERHFLVKDAATGRSRRLPLPFVLRDFAQEFIYSEKIFTVDFKRPGAGTYNLNLDLTADQYIQKLQHDVTDQTIADVTGLVGKIAPSGLQPRLAAAGEDVKKLVEDVESVVAVGMFEIEAPDFELQMSAFVNRHLNQAHDAWVVPNSVPSLHRAYLCGVNQAFNNGGDPVMPNGAPGVESRSNSAAPQVELRGFPSANRSGGAAAPSESITQ